MVIPLSQLDEISKIARERYMTCKKDEAFPFYYALPLPKIGSIDMVYQEVLVDYRHDIGVYVEIRKEQSND